MKKERTAFARVSDLRNWVGLSENGINLYEKEGIISPGRDKANNYRILTIADGDKLFRARILTGYGFSIKETARILKEESFEDQYELLYDKENELNEKIIEMSHQVQQIREMLHTLNEMRLDPTFCEIVTGRSGFFLPVHDQHMNYGQGNSDCAEWLTKVPYVTSSVVTQFPTDSETIYWFGPVISRTHAYRLGVPLNNAIATGIDCSHYVRTFCTYPLEKNITTETVEHAVNYARERGLQIKGRLIATHLMIENTQEGMMVYDEVFLPVCM